jgi:hypothetical protein
MVAGLAWALTPKVWAHLGAGHVGLVFAAAWLPWVAVNAVQLARSPINRSLLPLTWSLQFVADPRLAAYTAAAVLMAALWWIAGQRQAGKPTTIRSLSQRKGWGRISLPLQCGHKLRLLPPWLAAGFLSIALTAVLWLPFLDYLPNTHRIGLTMDQSAVFSLPPSGLLGLLWADRGGFHEWMTYVGVSVLVLALIGWLSLSRRARWGVSLGLALLVLFSLGEHSPLYSVVAHLPGATLLRVPPRVWFLVSFGLAMLSGLGGEAVATSADRDPSGRERVLFRYRRGLNRLSFAALGAAAIMAVGVSLMEGNPSVAGALWATLVWLLLVIAACSIAQRQAWPARTAGGLIIVLVTAELAWMDASLVVRQPADKLFSDGWETSTYLAHREGRVYAPSFRPPPQVAAVQGVRTVSGVDPLQPADYATFLSAAAGVPASGEYSVTLPPLTERGWGEESLDPSLALADAVPSPWLLAVLDVDTVVSQFPIHAPWLQEIFRHDGEGLVVYRNRTTVQWPAVYRRVQSVPDLDAALAWLETGLLSREAVVTDGRPLDGPSGHTPAELALATPNRLLVRATGPGLLAVSELAHPGWEALVDGTPAEILPVDGVLRGVYLGDGQHEVEMIYRPWTVTVGVIISAVALVLTLSIRVAGRRET